MKVSSFLKRAAAVAVGVAAVFAAGEVRAETTSDYVQDGLIAIWDGYENTGSGGHATSLTEWKDTSGTYSFVFNSGANITVDGGALVFAGGNADYATLDAAGTDATFEAAKDGTCEIVIIANPLTKQNVALQSSSTAGMALGALARNNTSAAAGLIVNAGNNRPFPSYNWSDGTNTFTITYTSGLAQNAWANAGSLTLTGSDAWVKPDDKTYLGHRANLASGQAFAGKIFAIRLYSKKLDAEDIAKNRAVDVARFVEGDYSGEFIRVKGSPSEFGSPTPDYGVQKDFVAGQNYTFTCPAVYTNDAADVAATCRGWTLALTNGAVTAGSEREKTITYDATVTRATLTWNWDVDYKVTAVAESDGTVTNAGQWVRQGGVFNTLAQTSDPTKTFYRWTDGNGRTVGRSAALSMTITEPVALTASFRDAFHVNPTGGHDDTGDGTPGNPYKTLPFAYSQATDESTIFLQDGTYELESQLTITKPIAVKGASREGTIVTCKSGSKIRILNLNNANAEVSGLTVRGGYLQTAISYGAGMLVDAGVVSNCLFTGNTAYGNGIGGAGVGLNGGLVTHCIVSNNTSTIGQFDSYGGAVYVNGGTMRASLICNNTGSNQSGKYVNVGGVAMYGGLLESCSVMGNTAPGCGGVWVRNSSARVRNCAIFANTADPLGGGYWEWRGSSSSFTKCASDLKINDNCVTGTYYPVNAGSRDYHPLPGSCTIGTGAVQDWMTGAGDLDGNAMVVDEKTDIGCYQYQNTQLAGLLVVDKADGIVPLVVLFTAIGDAPSPITSYEWTFGDGTTATTSTNTISHTYASASSYAPSVKMCVQETGESKVFPLEGGISVGAPDLYVTAVENAKAAPPYATEETAATNVFDALDYAHDGASVHLLAGTHFVDRQVTISKAIAVKGASREETTVTCKPGKSIRIMNLNNANAEVSGLTVSGGYLSASRAYGAGVLVDAGVVSNCLFTGNKNNGNGSGGAGVGLNGGLVTHCIVSNNSSTITQFDGYGGNVFINGGTMRTSLICNNAGYNNSAKYVNVGGVAMTGGLLESCSVMGNSAPGCGGVWIRNSAASVRNCAIFANTADPSQPTYDEWRAGSTSFTKCASDHKINDNCVTGSYNAVSVGSSDWHPLPGSCTIGTGSVQTWMTGAGDLDGNAMVVDEKTDIGCYQYQKGQLSGSLSVDKSDGVAPLAVLLTASGDASAPITSYEWTFGDGATTTTTENTISHTYTAVGSYVPTVKMYVQETGESKVFPLEGSIVVGAPHLYVTAAENAKAEPPYATVETAATNIFDALSYVHDGASVHLLAGTHYVDRQFEMTRPFSIRGAAADPERTVIRKKSANGSYRVARLNNAKAFLTGVVLEGGYYNAEGSVLLIGTAAGVVSNCVIRNGSQNSNGVQGGGACLYAGLLTHCVLTNNVGGTTHGYGHSGGVLAMWGASAVAEFCLVASNHVWCTEANGTSKQGPVIVRAGTVRNCSVVGNHAGIGTAASGGYGGLSYCGDNTANVRIENCIVAANTSDGSSVSELRKIADDTIISRMFTCFCDVPKEGADPAKYVYDEALEFKRSGGARWLPCAQSLAAHGAAQTAAMAGATYLNGVPVPERKPAAGCYPAATTGFILIVR